METPPETLAAIDLGSNSFHMIIARLIDGQLHRVDKLKDMVRLGGGLDADNNLTSEARERALTSLGLFGERLRQMPVGTVRAVGTNTLRKAKNSREFLREAEERLGHSIEIISGREEGRLIYLGVAHGVFDPDGGRRLVVDIGGGSTEVMIGESFDMQACESLYMGCVSYSQEFFPKGKISRKRFDKAVIAAQQELRSLENAYPSLGWEAALGCSGTIKAVQSILTNEDLGTYGISLPALERLRDELIDIGHTDDINDLSGLSSRRAPVFPGGLAILIGLFKSLGVKRMTVSDFALREGVIYDLWGRVTNHDVRDATINLMEQRYLVDPDHAARVEQTALELLQQVADSWGLEEPIFASRLRWACRLHEIGLAVSHSRYHKHGSYLVENSDMPGFSRRDQQLLWAMIRSHRRRFKPHRFDGLPEPLPLKGAQLCVLLRLAILLNRTRAPDAVPRGLTLKAKNSRKVKLQFPKGWLAQAPLTVADLEQEKSYMKDAGFKLLIGAHD